MPPTTPPPVETKPDAKPSLKADMPRIPGVGVYGTTASTSNARKVWSNIALFVFALALGAGITWWIRRSAHNKVSAAPAIAQTTYADALAPQAAASAPAEVLPTTIPLDDLAAPWSSKGFAFVDPKTHENIPSMIIRLPEGSANNSNSYWAFVLRAPFSKCDLDYITDTNELATRYNFSASHPMLVAPCDGTVYDPLRLGNSLYGAWVRGAIAQGTGIRPPLAIEVRVQGREILADRSE